MSKSLKQIVGIFVAVAVGAFLLIILIDNRTHNQIKEEGTALCKKDAQLAANQRVIIRSLINVVQAEIAQGEHPTLNQPIVTQLQETLDNVPNYDC